MVRNLCFYAARIERRQARRPATTIEIERRQARRPATTVEIERRQARRPATTIKINKTNKTVKINNMIIVNSEKN